MSALAVDGPRPAVEWITSMPYRLTDAEFRVLMLMALDSYDGVTTAPGYDNLALWSGLLRSSVAAALSRLCEPSNDRPALLRRVGKRQRHTVFAFSRPASTDRSSRPVAPDEWAWVSSGRAGPVVSSGQAGPGSRDTPVDPSGHAGHTLPTTTRAVTYRDEVDQVGDRPSGPPEIPDAPVSDAQDGKARSRCTSPNVPARHMHIYAMPGERYGFVRLSGSEGRQWFRDRGIPRMWSHPHRAHQVRQERLADIAAIAEREGWHVHEHTKKPTI